MKRTIFAMAFALLVSVAFVSGVMAQQSTPPATQSAPSAPAKSAPAKMDKFRGTIEKIDPAAKEIVVKKGNDEKTFSFGDQTKFMQGKKELASSDLKKGEHVSVHFKKEGDKLTAEKIYVKMKTTAQKKSIWANLRIN